MGLGLLGCGVGDEVFLGRYHERTPDSSHPDGGGSDVPGNNDAGDGAPPWADAGDASAVSPECLVPIEREPIACIRVPASGPYLPHIKWQFPPPSLQLTQDSPPGTPLVANLTDDNGDGHINLCDVPDVAWW